MKRIFIFIFLLFSVCDLFCQNLIPNHSFEKVIKIDSFFSRNYTSFNTKMGDWSSPTQSSPDIIHEPYIEKMSMEGTNFIRKNFFIKPLKPKSGRIFAGIKVYGCVPENTHCREYLQVKILKKMEIGRCYEYSYWTNPLTNGSRINNMGVAFSESIVREIGIEEVLDIGNRYGGEDIINPGPGNWQEIKGIIKATFEWNYMIIGNFFHDFETDEISSKDGYPWGYYMIDDVSLINVDCDTKQPISKPSDLKITLNFESNSSILSEIQLKKLKIFFEEVKDKDYRSINVFGHADEVGDIDFNQELSLKRANAVRIQLIKLDVVTDDIFVAGFGESSQLSNNDKEKNRRVEVEVIY